MKRILFIAVAAIVLSGCSTIDLFTGSNQNGLGATTVADLTTATKIAQAEVPPDMFQVQCYTALISFIQTQQAQNAAYAGLTVNGLFSALAAIQAGQNQIAGVLSPATVAPLEQGCGPLLIRIQNTPAAFLTGLAAIGVH